MQITLEELLLSRDERAAKQKEMLMRHSNPLISFTMNIPGAEKTSPAIERAFSLGRELIDGAIADFAVNESFVDYNKCGPVLIYSVKADAVELKKRLCEIEENHPIGRLFDMDVIDSEGKKLDRGSERFCIICSAPGRACAAGRIHPVSELTERVSRMISDFFANLDAKRIALLIEKSLIEEVETAPKPGLVDPITCGSHKDMNTETFKKSAASLKDYFEEAVKCGYQSKGEECRALFERLRSLGIEAEKKMLAATDGVNTHKGAIFSLGIISGAIGRLITPDGYIPKAEQILAEAGKIAERALESDLPFADGKTAGERAYLNHGERGIRGEAADGFPSIKSIALPTFKEYISKGKKKKDAGALTLLHLIANVYDTSLYKRGGNSGVLYAKQEARLLLQKREPKHSDIAELDRKFTERNLSPGGSADLLAITYFLFEIENSRITYSLD